MKYEMIEKCTIYPPGLYMNIWTTVHIGFLPDGEKQKNIFSDKFNILIKVGVNLNKNTPDHIHLNIAVL